MGLCFIVAASFVSRSRNKDKKESDDGDGFSAKLKQDRSIRMQQAMERLDFATKSEEERRKRDVSQDIYEGDY